MEREDGEVNETGFERSSSSPLVIVNRSKIDRLVRVRSCESGLLRSREGGECCEIRALKEVGGCLVTGLGDHRGQHHLEEREEEFEDDLEPS